MEKIEISQNTFSERFLILRGQQVMLDCDLAEIYQFETNVLKRTVKRNMKRFPVDFMFELSTEEFNELRKQNKDPKFENGRGGIRYAPFAFTEAGIAMLASVLRSKRAVQVSIAIMRFFVQHKKQSKESADLELKVGYLENGFSGLRLRIDHLENKASFEKPNKLALAHENLMSLILDIVSKYFGIAVADLQSASRKKSISFPRQVAIYLARNQLNMSFSELGCHFGKRDHTSIMHAYRKINTTSGLQETLNFLEAEIRIKLRGRQPAHLRSLLA